MKKLLTVFLFFSALVSPIFAQAQDDGTRADINETDARIIGEILAANSYEITLLKMAVEKATNQELRGAVTGMLAEQQKMDAEFTAYANRLNIRMNPEKREKYSGTAAQINDEQPGKTWDKNVVEELITMHRSELDMLQMAERDSKDEGLKQLSVNSMPVLQSNLDRLVLLRAIVTGNTAPQPELTKEKVKADKKEDLPRGEKKDAKYFSDVLQMNSYELQLMELILKKGNHRALRDAVQRMLEDHQKLDARLREYAAGHPVGNIDITAQVLEKANKWRQKKGGMEWDADVIEELIDLHKDGVDMMQDSHNDVQDEALKMIINETLPVLQSHQQELKALKETVKKPWKKK